MQERLNSILQMVDRLEPQCNFGVYDFQCTFEQLQARDRWHQLMSEAQDLEVRLGL